MWRERGRESGSQGEREEGGKTDDWLYLYYLGNVLSERCVMSYRSYQVIRCEVR
jgi:hypothetical protein